MGSTWEVYGWARNPNVASSDSPEAYSWKEAYFGEDLEVAMVVAVGLKAKGVKYIKIEWRP
jgi:hypothetical protein